MMNMTKTPPRYPLVHKVIEIRDNRASDIFFGLVSLASLANQSQSIPSGTYVDSPRYTFRGVHLDVARNFRGLAFIETLIKEMAWLKLNKLHLHLADDEGWRLEINRSEEHTSELQSLTNLVCRLLLEKKTNKPFSSIP